MSETTITNLTGKLIWVVGNSGAALSVMPGASCSVDTGEVLNNPKLRELHDRKMIRTDPPYGDHEAAKSARDEAKEEKAAARRAAKEKKRRAGDDA
jgi:hypothetical protein